MHSDNRRLFILTAFLFSMVFLFAFSVTMIGPLVPTLLDQFHISIAESGLVSIFKGIGAVLVSLLGIFVFSKADRPKLIFISFLVFCIAVILTAFAPSYLIFLALFFIVGASTKGLDMITNLYIADLYPTGGETFTNYLHGFYGLGALLGRCSRCFSTKKTSI